MTTALDAAAYANRWRPRHPAEKAVLSLGLLALTLVLPRWPGAPLCGVVALALLLGPAGVRPAVVWRLLRTPLGFVLAGAVPLVVTVGGDPWLLWNPAALPEAAAVSVRAAAAVVCLLLFAATTPLADVLPRLVRLGVPDPITDVTMLVYRMLWVLLTSLHAVREAQASRLGFRTWATTYRSVAGQAGAVFVQAFDRAHRLEQGLALRGYTGTLDVRLPDQRIDPRFVAATVVLLGSVTGAALLLREGL